MFALDFWRGENWIFAEAYVKSCECCEFYGVAQVVPGSCEVRVVRAVWVVGGKTTLIEE